MALKVMFLHLDVYCLRCIFMRILGNLQLYPLTQKRAFTNTFGITDLICFGKPKSTEKMSEGFKRFQMISKNCWKWCFIRTLRWDLLLRKSEAIAGFRTYLGLKTKLNKWSKRWCGAEELRLTQRTRKHKHLRKNAWRTLSLMQSLTLNIMEVALWWEVPMTQTVMRKKFIEGWRLTVWEPEECILLTANYRQSVFGRNSETT